MDRRQLLRIGGLGALGLNLPALCAAGEPGARGQGSGSTSTSPNPQSVHPLRGYPRYPQSAACILLFYYGGPSHLDTWDMKPEAPAEVRGEYRPIDTSASGIRICEHLPLTARVMHHVALIRSMHHRMGNHNSAAVEALCGRTPLGGDLELLADDTLSFPCYGAALGYALRGADGPMASVALPHTMHNIVRLPGQSAGLLGSAYQPYQVESDPNTPGFTPGELDLPAGLSRARLEHRESLLRLVDRQLERTDAWLGTRAAPAPYARAFDLLRAPEVRRAFDLGHESERTRERYGRNKHGQSVLLARRLVETGARCITVYDGVHNGQEANWDSHANLFPRHRELLPPADRAFSALVEDLEARGLLDTTLVVWMGEFGRTPKINGSGGRDHWPDCYSIALAGGGVKGGTVHGESDATGAYPERDPVRPGDLAATFFRHFGLDPATEYRDASGRPFPLADGEPVRALFRGG